MGEEERKISILKNKLIRGRYSINLLYIWNDNYDIKEKYKHTGFQLNTKYDIQYNEVKNELSIKKNQEYVPDFWGDNIADVIAIVGENGAGKTSFLHFLMYAFECMEQGRDGGIDFFAVFGDTDNKKLIIMATKKYQKITVRVPHQFWDVEKVGEKPNDILMVYKIGYFTNALSLADYQWKKHGYIDDKSVGGLIYKDFSDNYSNHYIDYEQNILLNYFNQQFLRIINFIYSRDIDKFSIPFPKPKYIEVIIKNYNQNEKYIASQLEKMTDYYEIKKLFPKQQFRFKHYFEPLYNNYGRTWVNNLLINLLIDLFKEICIPDVTPDDRSQEVIKFIELLEEFRKSKEFKEKSIYEVVQNFINRISSTITKRKYYQDECEKYNRFVSWIEKHSEFLNRNSEGNQFKCLVPVKYESKEFMMELLHFYNTTSFPYPYFEFYFGVSTGEMNFLNLFANIYDMFDTNDDGNYAVFNNTAAGRIVCTSLLLIFDEADLSLHPRWQRGYLDCILEFVKSVFPGCSVHILIATHSPIMLSDFPKNNVIYMSDDIHMSTRRDINTFGNNIHNLFLDSFFLNDAGTIGAFAENKINGIVEQLESGNLDRSKMDNILKMISYVGEDLIKNKLLQLYDEKSDEPVAHEIMQESSEAIDMTINMLRFQKEQIEQMIKELERKKHDKNFN